MDEPLKLDIGCGPTVKAGYTGVDMFITGENIVTAPMWHLPYKDGEVSEIFSSHALEHIPKKMVMQTLKEWLRVLVPGGTIFLAVPDLEWCCRQWLEHQSDDWWLDILFGNQERPGEFHMTGFTTGMLIHHLREAGFVDIESGQAYSHRQNTLIFQARKAD